MRKSHFSIYKARNSRNFAVLLKEVEAFEVCSRGKCGSP
jgi:hypothetical protein